MIMKINKKYTNVLFALFMGLSMGLIISFILTLLNIGFIPNFFFIWMRGFGLGFAVAFPTALIIMPYVRKIICRITSD